MGRLGAFVVVGALTAPLGATVTADTRGAAPPPPAARAYPASLDLTAWYARVDAGGATAMLGAPKRVTHRFGKGVAAHWPRAGRIAAISGIAAPPGGKAGRGASPALSATVASRWSFGWHAMAGHDHALARRLMRDAVYRARAPVGARTARRLRPRGIQETRRAPGAVRYALELR